MNSGITTFTTVSRLDRESTDLLQHRPVRSRNGASTMSSGMPIRSSNHAPAIRLASSGSSSKYIARVSEASSVAA